MILAVCKSKISNFAKKCKNNQDVFTMIKALFFDIDGTLVSFNTHEIPQSTIDAITEAKRQGIKIFISTGRPMAFINNIKHVEHLLDGYITTNGACCTTDGQNIKTSPIPTEDKEKILDFVDNNNIGCVLMGIENAALINTNSEAEDIIFNMLKVRRSDLRLNADEIRNDDILQITPFVSEQEENYLMKSANRCISSRWHPAFTDITSDKADKGTGLETIANHIGIDIHETMAFGDGGNDIAILSKAGIGVAMGNALDNVKERASYVTTSVDDDGVANALRHFNIIK